MRKEKGEMVFRLACVLTCGSIGLSSIAGLNVLVGIVFRILSMPCWGF